MTRKNPSCFISQQILIHRYPLSHSESGDAGMLSLYLPLPKNKRGADETAPQPSSHKKNPSDHEHGYKNNPFHQRLFSRPPGIQNAYAKARTQINGSHHDPNVQLHHLHFASEPHPKSAVMISDYP
jgi:hypothetical protein